MAPQPIVFAMANPDPEITYEEAKASRDDIIMATGRSDYPNQVNNVLGFPFIFRGASRRTRHRHQRRNEAGGHPTHWLRWPKKTCPTRSAAPMELSALKFGRDYVIPKPFDPRVLVWEASLLQRRPCKPESRRSRSTWPSTANNWSAGWAKRTKSRA